ncbi:hypothetical protein CYR55_22565 [Chimaeribacter californicus]|uniref:Uncharacterized protein n=1 Tax=Chimaeribacter californicus TaxID=2060067 RepID=A0A2N5DTJ8_9GAMM|nr:hypothetical protein [Chimaeribacter californicus]PLR29876.1 hypothetical protein CYR55_22565 [Chimaeribacter californicus]
MKSNIKAVKAEATIVINTLEGYIAKIEAGREKLAGIESDLVSFGKQANYFEWIFIPFSARSRVKIIEGFKDRIESVKATVAKMEENEEAAAKARIEEEHRARQLNEVLNAEKAAPRDGIRVLRLSAGALDQVNSFGVEVVTPRGIRRMNASLHMGKVTRVDGLFYGISIGNSLKETYTAEDRAETRRIDTEEPVRHGDVVRIGGKLYTARVIGEYTTPVEFDALPEVAELGK